jgi:hypothetical protein
VLSKFAETHSALIVLRHEEVQQRTEQLAVLEGLQVKSLDTMKDLVQIASGSTQPRDTGAASTQHTFSSRVQQQRHAAYALAIHRSMDEAGCADASVQLAVLLKAPEHWSRCICALLY